MKMYCCGVIYSTQDPETYWCVRKDIMKQSSKTEINGIDVAREVIYTLICKKNGCTRVEIHRYATSEENHLIEKESFSGKKALKFLESTVDVRISQPLKCPYQKVPTSKRVPYVYGKAIDDETQRARYISEEGWASDKLIYSPVKVISELLYETP